MLNIITGILLEAISLFNKMSPYLLFGFFFAGLLHIFLKVETIARHFGKRNILSVVKAALLGIPLPLCSCGVIPATVSLSKKGASKGAALSFLISTPTSGVDSILATYSLLGPLFAAYRVIACGLTAICAGVIANLEWLLPLSLRDIPLREGDFSEISDINDECEVCKRASIHKQTVVEKIKGAIIYSFVELVGDIGKWLLIGVLMGGAILYLIPDEFIQKYLGSDWLAMPMMLLIGIPMYVCACGAIPIAAALIAKGMSVGAGFVFLLAGPATNIAALIVLSRHLGLKTMIVYLGSISVCSLGFGWLLNIIWSHPAITTASHIHGRSLPQNLQIVSSIILLGLIGYSWIQGRRQQHGEGCH